MAKTEVAHTSQQERAVATAQLIPDAAKQRLSAFWRDNGRHIMSVVAGQDTKAIEAAVYSCLYRTPQLINCTPFSLVNAIVLANQLELRVGTPEASLVPFGSEATLIIGYQGKVKLALASKLIKSVEAEVVYTCDEFTWERNASGLNFHHKPNFQGRWDAGQANDQNIVGAYCQLATDGGMQTRFVDIGEILDARNKSRSYRKDPKNSFWTTDFAAACLKTAIHRATKLAPQDAKLGRANEVDDEDLDGTAVLASGIDPSQFSLNDTQKPIAELSHAAQEEVVRKKLDPVRCISQEQADDLLSVYQERVRKAMFADILKAQGVPSGKALDVPVNGFAEVMEAVQGAA